MCKVNTRLKGGQEAAGRLVHEDLRNDRAELPGLSFCLPYWACKPVPSNTEGLSQKAQEKPAPWPTDQERDNPPGRTLLENTAAPTLTFAVKDWMGNLEFSLRLAVLR